MKNILFICIIFAFLGGCAFKNTKLQKQFTDQGIVVLGTFNPVTHSLLYLTSGIHIVIDGDEELTIPWERGQGISLNRGWHKFRVWYNWLGSAGIEEGCFHLAEGQTVAMKYSPPLWGPFSSPDVDLFDAKTSKSVENAPNCPH